MSSLTDHLTDPSWKGVLGAEFIKPYFLELEERINARRKAGATIFPPREDTFSAFNLTPLESVKVVILGQDPYHGAGQAMGLSFSVHEGVRVPPSLKNMFKEIEADLGAASSCAGDLSTWARQGVLLLNSILTVEEKKAGAHAKFGWETFTDRAISVLSENRSDIVFLLWGAHAQKKATLVDEHKHKVLIAPHPSPLSAYKGFLGCQHFSLANAYLKETGQSEVHW